MFEIRDTFQSTKYLQFSNHVSNISLQILSCVYTDADIYICIYESIITRVFNRYVSPLFMYSDASCGIVWQAMHPVALHGKQCILWHCMASSVSCVTAWQAVYTYNEVLWQTRNPQHRYVKTIGKCTMSVARHNT